MEYPKLPTEFKEKWVNALKSGKYEQARGMLHDGTGYCCLGVACHIVGIDDEVLDGEQVIEGDWVPDSVPFELVGEAVKNDVVREVATMNDGGTSFTEIADWIEQNL